MMQGFLADVVIVQPIVALECRLQVVSRVEPVSVQDIAYSAVKSLHHAIRLWSIRRNEAVINPLLGTEPIHAVPASGLTFAPGSKAIRKGLAVVGQQRLDLERGALTNML